MMAIKDDLEERATLQTYLSKEFEMKHLRWSIFLRLKFLHHKKVSSCLNENMLWNC